MRQIYENATRVVVYLGEFNAPSPSFKMRQSRLPTTDASMFLFDDRDEGMTKTFLGWLETPFSLRKIAKDTYTNPAFHVFCLIRMLASDGNLFIRSASANTTRVPLGAQYLQDIFEGLRACITCKWWSRVWVVQEIVVAKKLSVMYGAATAPWAMFVEAAK